MRHLFGFVLLLFLCLAWTGSATGQTNDSLYVEVSLLRGQPLGTLENNLLAPGLGGRTAIGGRVPGVPLVLLSEVSLLTYDRNDHLELNRLREQFREVDFSVPISTINFESNHHLFTGHLVARLQPAIGLIEPYVDGLLGLKYFTTRTRLEGDLVFERRGLTTSSNFDDLVLSYGVGGGLQLRLFEHSLGLSEEVTRLSVDLGVRYLLGPPASYLGEDSIRLSEEGLTIVPVRSRTDLLIPYLGLQIER